MSAITAKASRKMKKYAVLTREPRCFLGSFDFSWEQRKAIDIADYSKGNGYSKGDLTDAGTPIILYGRLYTKYQFAISEVDTFAVPRNGAVYSQGNEVIVPASGETAEDIARASAVEKSGVLLGGDLNILRPFDFINPLFLALAISNGEPQKELAKKAQGKSVVHIHNTDIQEVTIAYPSRTEQDRIVSVFRQLDHLITLHQRKCANLCSPSQVVFSLLFATSTFSWEQRKLGEVGETYTGLSGKSKDDFGHGSGKFITYMNVFSNPVASPNMTEAIEIDDSQNKVRFGDVLFTTSSETPDEVGMSSVWLENAENTYLNSFCFGYRPTAEFNPYYLAYMLRSSSMRKKITFLAQGISRYNISKNKMMDIEMPIPSIDEQKQIGEYFANLDNLITLHQRECISFTGRADRLILTANKKRTTSSWEQRKVREITDRYDNLRIPVAASLRIAGTTPYYGANGIQDYVEGYTHDGEFILVAEDGANDLKNYPVKCVKGRIWVNNHAHVLQGKCACADNQFLAYAISQADIESLLVGGGRAKLNAETLMDIELLLPSKDEQRQIGSYLARLDNLITLHQRKPFLMKWRTSDANRNQTNRLVL